MSFFPSSSLIFSTHLVIGRRSLFSVAERPRCTFREPPTRAPSTSLQANVRFCIYLWIFMFIDNFPCIPTYCQLTTSTISSCALQLLCAVMHGLLSMHYAVRMLLYYGMFVFNHHTSEAYIFHAHILSGVYAQLLNTIHAVIWSVYFNFLLTMYHCSIFFLPVIKCRL